MRDFTYVSLLEVIKIDWLQCTALFWVVHFGWSTALKKEKKTTTALYKCKINMKVIFLPSVKQASGSRVSSGSTTGCSSAGAPMSTVLPSDELLLSLSFWPWDGHKK